jgi:hypothetical protein
MISQRNDYPLFDGAYAKAAGDAPVLLDGMEVVFDRTVGLAPVTLVPKKRVKSETQKVPRA